MKSTYEVSRELGFRPRTLQRWAKIGLVVPGVRTPGGHARYTENDVRVLRVARTLIDRGFSLPQLRKLLPIFSRVLEGLVA